MYPTEEDRTTSLPSCSPRCASCCRSRWYSTELSRRAEFASKCLPSVNDHNKFVYVHRHVKFFFFFDSTGSLNSSSVAAWRGVTKIQLLKLQKPGGGPYIWISWNERKVKIGKEKEIKRKLQSREAGLLLLFFLLALSLALVP